MWSSWYRAKAAAVSRADHPSHGTGPRSEGRAAPLRPQWPQRLLGDSLVRFGGWSLPPPSSGDAKALSATLLRVWRGMSRQRGAAPGQARVSTLDDGGTDSSPPGTSRKPWSRFPAWELPEESAA